MKPIVIVGGGCAGLSLAVHLLDAGVTDPIRIIEPREAYGDDRTWCGFRMDPHPFDACITHEWSRWRVRHRDAAGRCEWSEHGTERHAYVHVSAGSFYDHARSRLEAAGSVELSLGVRALQVRTGHVETSEGGIDAGWIFDSRPVPVLGGLRQHFRGFFVRTEQARFDPGVATLMDFAVPQTRGLRFVYVLPFDAHNALIEDTFVTPQSFPIDDSVLEHVLEGAAHEVLREESGCIPMSASAPIATPARTLRIGTGGGLVKPSSGYAFEFIQRHSASVARALVRGETPRPYQRQAWMDQVMLEVLQKHSDWAPELFVMMFRNNPPERLARFMMETSSPIDALGIMRSLPATPFMKAAMRAMLRGARAS